MIRLKRLFICIFLFTSLIQGESQSSSQESIENPIDAIVSTTDSVDKQDQAMLEEENVDDDDELFDIRPEVALPHHALFYCLSFLLGLFILLFILALIRKWRNKQAVPTVVPLSPYAKALQGLDAALECIHQKDQKPFAFGLTDSVRQYLADVFNLPAPESTTEEVLENLKDINELNEGLKGAINQLLKSCDLAKFTKQEFDYEMRLNLYHQAKEIVQEADKSLQQKLAMNLSNEETHANV